MPESEIKTATLIGPAPGQWTGDAKLYRLDPPHNDTIAVVVSSATDLTGRGLALDAILGLSYRSSETMVFPWDTEAETVADWGEIGFVPYKSHADALADMGYTVDGSNR